MNTITQKIINFFVGIFLIIFIVVGVILYSVQGFTQNIAVIKNFQLPIKQILWEINEEISQNYTPEKLQQQIALTEWRSYRIAQIKKLDELRFVYDKELLNNDLEALIKAINQYDKQYTPKNWSLVKNKLTLILKKETQSQDIFFETLQQVLQNIYWIILSAGTVVVLLVAFMLWQFFSSLLVGFKVSRELLTQVERGEVIQSTITLPNEFNILLNSAKALSNKMQEVSKFIQSIGEGKFNNNFQPTSTKDILGVSLIQMKQNLQKINEEDGKRIWANEGYTQTAEILRVNAQMHIEDLCQNIICFLVEYLHANQGACFIKKELANKKIALELVATYAYNRKKFLEKTIMIDDEHAEGLLGQVYLNKKTVHLRDLPENYITISSGLGEAKPNNVLIVPLKYNETLEGVIEIASFNLLEAYQIHFVERISESIAASVASIRNNKNTEKLLKELQIQTETLRKQENEMMQNLQALQSTQQQMREVEVEREKLLANVQQLANIVENHPDFIGSFSLKGDILYINPAGLRMLGAENLDQLTNKNITAFYPPEEATKLTQELIPRAIQEKDIFCETILQRFDNTLLPVEQVLAINYDKEGKPQSMSLTIGDISQRKEKEKEITLYQKTLLNILDKIPGKIFLKDAQGKMALANNEVARVYERTVENLLGTSDFDFFEHALAQSYRDQELEIMELGAKTYIQEEDLTGNLRYLQTTKMPFFIDYKQEKGLLGIQYDITETVVLEKTVKELKAENRKLKQQLAKLQKDANGE